MKSRHLWFAFEDNQYDVILCNHVLEHIPDDTKAMQELYRVLKPGGMAIYKPQELSRANFSDDTITDQKNALKYWTIWSCSHIWSWLFWQTKSIGFKVIEEDYTNKIAPEMVEKYCLAKGEIIPVCFK
jgi:ubiquinone/menaquinone biosynthesis C-methylase UbiE